MYIDRAGGAACGCAENEVEANNAQVRPGQMQRRLSKELGELGDNPYDIVRVGDGDAVRLRAVLRGPEDSVYQGGEFVLDIHVPADYPFKPPRVRFATNIFHPCVVPTVNATEHIRGDVLGGFAVDHAGLIDLRLS